jgi:hypothetical protein
MERRKVGIEIDMLRGRKRVRESDGENREKEQSGIVIAIE